MLKSCSELNPNQMTFRKLKTEEIAILQDQNCMAEDWSKVEVGEGFDPGNIHHVAFNGNCKIGKTSGKVSSTYGQDVTCGLYNSVIFNSSISDNVLIRNVQILANYTIESDVIIENVNELTVGRETTFGNGVEIDILNEGGGRELPIFDRLSSQIAYLLVTYRHDDAFIQLLKNCIESYVDGKKSSVGKVLSGSIIRNCITLQNLTVGPFATLHGAQCLVEGSIIGENGTKTFVGSGVVAKNFIIQSGSSVDSSALIENTFIGQGVKIGKQFSAENSAFFANSEGFHGEAVSVFGGPYTVTHHKSTLLIAGMYSFFNAGSGTNQSNHMYKLGPLHQGIVERGSKTGSFSYLLWPCKVGPFSVVMGKHGSNFDTSDLPFSYLTVENEKSALTPAMNLITVGTKRDSVKWPNRDRRKGNVKLDLIHFELFNPFVMNKILNGIDILNDLYEKTPREQEIVSYKGVRIKRLMLKTCRKYYEMAMHIFIGDQILNLLNSVDGLSSIAQIQELFTKSEMNAGFDWIDMTGLVVPHSALEKMVSKMKKIGSPDLEEVEDSFKTLYDHYETYKWDFMLQILENRFFISGEKISSQDVVDLMIKWKENNIRLNNMILGDAKKEFDANSRIGFGLGGDVSVQDADFELVRGTYEENSFVKGLREENEEIENTATAIIRKLEKLK